jgi:predicted nuclease of predicted toxin-antitoxin system
MKLLLDQDVYAATVRFLFELGHDVVPVARIGLSRAQNQEILRIAQEQNRILVTRDRDFDNLVFLRRLGAGVIYLRIVPSTQNVVHGELERVLDLYTEKELARAFVVVEPGGHRIRRLPTDTYLGPHHPVSLCAPRLQHTSASRSGR